MIFDAIGSQRLPTLARDCANSSAVSKKFSKFLLHCVAEEHMSAITYSVEWGQAEIGTCFRVANRARSLIPEIDPNYF